MIAVLKHFNDLLNRTDAKAVGVISNDGSSENKPEAVVSGKPTPEGLKEAIEQALTENLDVDGVEITSAEEFDYGHGMEIKVSYIKDEEYITDESYYVNHAIVY